MLIRYIVLSLWCLSLWSVKVKFATVAPQGTPWAETLEQIKKEVKKTSNGEINIKTYLGGQLGGELEIIQKVRRGQIQGAGVTFGALASVVNELNVFELPYLFSSNEEVDYVLDKHLFDDLSMLLREQGFVLVSLAENGWRNFGHKEKAILSPSDLETEKMRSQKSNVHLAFWKKLKASPQALAAPEVLSALQTGLVKGFDNTALFTLAAEWHTAIKHYTVSKHIYQPAAVIYSLKFWEKLSKKEQEILMGRGNQLAVESRLSVRALGDQLIEVMKSSGVKIHELDQAQSKKFSDLLMPLYDGLVKEIGGKASEFYTKIKAAKEAFKKDNQ